MENTFETTCPNCFSDKMNGEICSACGYESKNEKKNHMSLPHFTILKSRYLIGRTIGAGGFGITYKAYDIMSNTICCVKEYVPMGVVCRSEDKITMEETAESKHEAFVHGKKRFFEEAKVLYACKDIRDVVEITDYFQENNTVYFVMEYIQGVTLRKFVVANGGKLPINYALEILYDAGMALEQVHQKVGIFHRDISPENIMITSKGKVKIIDFGSAKNIDRAKQNLSVVLKPGFAPPEQYSSQSKQGRYTDVYALAGTFYYVLTGDMIPVAPERLTGSEYTKLTELGFSQEISDAVDHALELRYQDRFQTVAQFVEALMPSTSAVTTAQQESSASENYVQRTVKSQETKSTTGAPYLQILQGAMKGASWKIPSDVQILVGRSRNKSDIVIEGSAEISRPHFIVEYDSKNNQFYIIDVSTNGTYVEGYALVKNMKYSRPVNSTIVLGVDICTVKLGVTYER